MLAAIVLVNPVIHWINWEQFHPDAFEVPLALVAILLATSHRWRWYTVAVVAAAVCKEDVPFLVVGLGAWVALRHDRRVGLLTVGGSVLYLGAALFWWLPMWNMTGGTLDRNRVPFGGFGGLIKASLTRPWVVVGRALSEDKPWYVWQLYVSAGTLCLMSAEVALIAAGPLVMNLLINWWYAYHIEYHYTALIIGPFIAATIFGIGRVTPKFRQGFAAAALVIAGVAGWMWGPCQFARHPQPLGDRQLAGADQRAQLLDLVPGDASVSAHYSWVCHLSHRKEIYEWPMPWKAQNWSDYSLEGQVLPRPQASSTSWCRLGIGRAPAPDPRPAGENPVHPGRPGRRRRAA